MNQPNTQAASKTVNCHHPKYKMVRLYIPDQDGTCKSPLGAYDSSLEIWKDTGHFFEDIFVNKYPDSFLIEAKTDCRITYKRLYQVGHNVAEQLRASGVTSRSVIHLVGENCFDWLAVLLGSRFSDCVISATHPNSPWPECSRNLTTTCATVLVMTKSCFEK